jgi:hypothetical protein
MEVDARRESILNAIVRGGPTEFIAVENRSRNCLEIALRYLESRFFN